MSEGECDRRCHQEEAGERQRKVRVQIGKPHISLDKEFTFYACRLRNHHKCLSRGVT